MEWYEPEVRELERVVAERADGNRPPVFYGSSSIRMWTTLADDVDPSILNLGFGGSTLEACRYFFARLVPPAHPRSLLLYAGDNDLGDGRSPDAVFADLRGLADQVFSVLGPIPFGFMSIKLSPARYAICDRIRSLNELARAEIESRPSGFYVDIFTPMLDRFGKPRPEMFEADGLHLSRKGYRLWGRVLNNYRDRILTS
jgi:lysophospholipase L1-like esterase